MNNDFESSRENVFRYLFKELKGLSQIKKLQTNEYHFCSVEQGPGDFISSPSDLMPRGVDVKLLSQDNSVRVTGQKNWAMLDFTYAEFTELKKKLEEGNLKNLLFWLETMAWALEKEKVFDVVGGELKRTLEEFKNLAHQNLVFYTIRDHVHWCHPYNVESLINMILLTREITGIRKEVCTKIHEGYTSGRYSFQEKNTVGLHFKENIHLLNDIEKVGIKWLILGTPDTKENLEDLFEQKRIEYLKKLPNENLPKEIRQAFEEFVKALEPKD